MYDQLLKNAYYNKVVLVTGGAGFIGSHLVEQLLALGAQVRIVDNLSTGLAAQVVQEAQFFHGSVADYSIALKASAGAQVIFHCAAQTSVAGSFNNVLQCYQSNIVGTYVIAEVARINKVETIVFSSSAAVYGSQEGACSEMTPCLPTSPYGTSKLIGEYLLRQQSLSGSMATASLRYFNVYGPRQRFDLEHAGFIAKLHDALRHHKSLTIYGDGSQQRDFVPVATVVRANLLIGMIASIRGWQGESFNIASGISISLKELIMHCMQEYPTYDLQKIRYVAARHGDVHTSIADCTKYRRLEKEIEKATRSEQALPYML